MDKDLQDLLADVFNIKPGDVKPELSREDVDSWDSLKQMDLVMSLERAYDITLAIEDIVAMTSVAAIIGVLQNKGAHIEN